MPNDASGDKFIAQVQSYVSEQKVGPLLNKGIATRFIEAITSISKASSGDVSVLGFDPATKGNAAQRQERYRS